MEEIDCETQAISFGIIYDFSIMETVGSWIVADKTLSRSYKSMYTFVETMAHRIINY